MKIIVLSHGIKVCTVLNKLNIAHMLVNQIYANNEEMSDHTFYHLLFNMAHFSYTIHLNEEMSTLLFNKHYVRIVCGKLMVI